MGKWELQSLWGKEAIRFMVKKQKETGEKEIIKRKCNRQ